MWLNVLTVVLMVVAPVVVGFVWTALERARQERIEQQRRDAGYCRELKD
jgi:hypothetical protein